MEDKQKKDGAQKELNTKHQPDEKKENRQEQGKRVRKPDSKVLALRFFLTGLIFLLMYVLIKIHWFMEEIFSRLAAR